MVQLGIHDKTLKPAEQGVISALRLRRLMLGHDGFMPSESRNMPIGKHVFRLKKCVGMRTGKVLENTF